MFWNKSIKEMHIKIDRLTRDIFKQAEKDDKRLDSIEKVLIAQEINLKEHMRRSDHLETIVDQIKIKNEKELAPLKRHINMVEGAFKLLGILGILFGIVGGIVKAIGLI